VEVSQLFGGKIGLWELVLILAIALVIFGPQKLPEMGRSLGKGIKEFRKATKELTEEIDIDEEPSKEKKVKEEKTEEDKKE